MVEMKEEFGEKGEGKGRERRVGNEKNEGTKAHNKHANRVYDATTLKGRGPRRREKERKRPELAVVRSPCELLLGYLRREPCRQKKMQYKYSFHHRTDYIASLDP